MINIKERLKILNEQYQEMKETLNSKDKERDITQEFVLRSKLRDIKNLCKEWDKLSEEQKEIERKLQEIESSPPR